jgi:TonB family protein
MGVLDKGMIKKTVALMVLAMFLMPAVMEAENVSLRPSTGETGQKDPFKMTFRPAAEFMTKPARTISEKEGLEKSATMPYLIEMAKPITYPGWARRKGLEGLLVAALEILEDGSVGRWQIVRSTGDESLDRTAAKNFIAWKFQPALKDGKPVRTCIQVPINFELTEA